MNWLYVYYFNDIALKLFIFFSTIGVALLCLFIRYWIPKFYRASTERERVVQKEIKELNAKNVRVASELKAFKESFSKNNFEMISMAGSELV